MNKIRLALLAATAAGLMTAGYAAYAASNTANLDQSGDGNTAIIDQSGGDNNTVGVSVDSINQVNDNDAASNTLNVTQILGSNTLSTVTQNAIAGDGTNALTVTQKNEDTAATIGENTISTVTQYVNAGSTGNNTATITQDGEKNNITTVSQTNTGAGNNSILFTVDGDENGTAALTGFADILGVDNNSLIQNGTSNSIELNINGDLNAFGVKQLGGSNTLGASNTVNAIDITGSNNLLGILQDSSTAGDSNTLYISGINGDSNNVGVSQDGGVNTGEIKLGTTSGTSNNNAVRLIQSSGADAIVDITAGDFNSIDVTQQNAAATNNDVNISVTSTSVTSTNNTLTVLQDGDANDLDVVLNGDFNTIDMQQSAGNALTINAAGNSNSFNTNQTNSGGLANSITLDLFGSSNNTTAFTTASDAASIGLTAGELIQTGSGNIANLTIGAAGTDSDNNSLALSQLGSDNEAVVSITNGDNNQVAILQNGSSNYTNVAQVGSGNNVGITQ